MRLLRWTLVGCLIVGFAGCDKASSNKGPAGGSSQQGPRELTNKEKIVGTWGLTKGGDMPPGATFEFTKDGKMKVSAKAGNKTMNVEGTYEVDGDKLKTAGKGPDGKEQKETDTITKLTETELVLKDPKDQTAEFKKKK